MWYRNIRMSASKAVFALPGLSVYCSMTQDTAQAIRAAALRRLLSRRKALQDALDGVLSSPQSYSIQGSYSQTSQDAARLRDEIAGIDSAIRSLSVGTSPISRDYPRYTAE